ncbi:MAG: HipA domain-containing protein [Micrococcaceae bacterium]
MAEVDVYLYGTHIGTLSQLKNKYELRWTHEAISRFGFGAECLSDRLPIGFEAKTADIESFFGGLLPEAAGLKVLARRAKCPENDLLGLLKYTTPDLPGAVVLDKRQDGNYLPIDDKGIEKKMKNTGRYPLGNVGGGGSLTGYQPKITLTRFGEEWFDSDNGATSTHILKPSSKEHERSAWWEHYCLCLARELKLCNFTTVVTTFGQTPALVIERFDRKIKDKFQVEKIHQEDFSQVLGVGWDSDAKFEHNNPKSSYKNIAAVLKSLPNISAVEKSLNFLMYSLLFNLCIGNTDAHTKNHGLLKPKDGEENLAPLYDLFPLALSYEGTKSMALSVNDKTYLGSISLDDVLTEIKSWKVPIKNLEIIVTEFLEKLKKANSSIDIPEAGKHLPKYIDIVCSRLLEGKAAFPVTPIPFILTKM